MARDGHRSDPPDAGAYAFLRATYQDTSLPLKVRLEAAAKAIRYEKPALSAVEFSGGSDVVVRVVSDRPLTAEEWVAEVAGRKH